MQSIQDPRLRNCLIEIQNTIRNYKSDSIRHIIIKEKHEGGSEWLEITPKFLDNTIPHEALMVIFKAVEFSDLKIEIGSYVNNPFIIIRSWASDVANQL